MDPADVALLETTPMVDSDALPELIGWTLKPEGLCRADECVILSDDASIERDGKVDLVAVADALDRPAVVDEAAGLVAIGAARGQRRSAINDLRAPDFKLPDLDGTWHALSDHRSKKRLLVAFSSW